MSPDTHMPATMGASEHEAKDTPAETYQESSPTIFREDYAISALKVWAKRWKGKQCPFCQQKFSSNHRARQHLFNFINPFGVHARMADHPAEKIQRAGKILSTGVDHPDLPAISTTSTHVGFPRTCDNCDVHLPGPREEESHLEAVLRSLDPSPHSPREAQQRLNWLKSQHSPELAANSKEHEEQNMYLQEWLRNLQPHELSEYRVVEINQYSPERGPWWWEDPNFKQCPYCEAHPETNSSLRAHIQRVLQKGTDCRVMGKWHYVQCLQELKAGLRFAVRRKDDFYLFTAAEIDMDVRG